MVTAALNERILSDPDLAAMNDSGAVLAMPDPLLDRTPPFDRSGEEVRRSRDAALGAVGGHFVTLAQSDAAGPALAAATPLDVAKALPGARPCLAGAKPGAAWSASLPGNYPIVPRGHVVVAGGSDAPGCRLRAVRFVSTLPLEDLLGFYAARANQARAVVMRRRAGDAEIIGGTNWLIHARKRGDGLTEVDLVTTG